MHISNVAYNWLSKPLIRLNLLANYQLTLLNMLLKDFFNFLFTYSDYFNFICFDTIHELASSSSKYVKCSKYLSPFN